MYCKKHDRPYEDTSPCTFVPFWECPECIAEEAEQEQEWLSLEILAEYVPADPQTVTDETRAVYGEGPEDIDYLDLGASTNEMRDFADF